MNLFNSNLAYKPKRSKFDLSHDKKMTIPFGALIPTFVSEVLPGDSFRVNSNILARFQAMLAPFMDKVDIYTHYFYVPNRIISKSFARFITYQGNKPQSSVAASSTPYFVMSHAIAASIHGTGAGVKDGSLLDYLGFPTAPNDVTTTAGTGNYPNLRISAILPLAYQRIWNDHYRDQNTTHPIFSDETSIQDSVTNMAFFDFLSPIDTSTFTSPETGLLTSTRVVEALKLRWRCWERDYLTSALPTPQQGIGDPRVPINFPAGILGNTPAAGSPLPGTTVSIGKTSGIQYPSTPNNATDNASFTVSALRVAASLKRYLENSIKGGTRYAEQLWTRWHVKSSDASMQIAQYLGGGVQPMVISEVLSQAPATSTQNIPPGYMGGHGISFGNTNRFSMNFEEHGVVMGITSVVPRPSYLYSMPRAFMRSEPLDFATPEFANIGEQPILGAEVAFKMVISAASASAPNYNAIPFSDNYQGVTTRHPMGFTGAPYAGFNLQNDNPEASAATVWGYQERYAEYKFMPNTIHGLMRNNQSFWHFGRMFTGTPNLNYAFNEANPRLDGFAILPTSGGFTNYNSHPIMLQVQNNVSVVRSLPYYNTPSLW